MRNSQQHNHDKIDIQDISWIDLNQPEFSKLLELVSDFCDKPGLWERKSEFEQELSQMSFENLFDLYITRTDMSAWHNIKTTNVRARQIEKALWNYIITTGVSPEGFVKLNINIEEMNNIYESLKSEYSH